MTENVKEYFERWPEPVPWHDYEYDGPFEDEERVDFFMSLSEEEQREILIKEGAIESSLDILFEA